MAREHPLPTVATIKVLYAMAVRCAAPACLEPLFRRGADGQVLLLNSQVCHIAARRLGGPRWDAAMSASENAGASNLLLLCRSHHAEVDDLALVHLYPVDLLREWKADQVRLAEQLSRPFELSDEQAEEVLAVSFTVQMQGGTFNLGGQGGSFGGGGGGGAAWGAGAVGGQGGDGGHVNLSGGDGAAPGGGGGGGGWMAPDARPWPPGAAPVGHLGAAHVPDVDGLPGGDTSFGDPGDPFFVVAAGGAAARAGGGVRWRSDRIGVSSMVLVESAQIVDGKAYVLGGAWNRMALLNVPQTVSLQLLLVLEAAGVPVGEYTIRVELADPQGVESLLMTFPLSISEAGDIVRCPVHLIVQAGITAYGLWTLMVGSDVQELAQQAFMVTRVGSE